jgi:hypothetical protein
MLQMPDEVTHDRANNQAGNELEKPKDMEGDSRVMAWSGLRPPVESFEHVGSRQFLSRPENEHESIKRVTVKCTKKMVPLNEA